MRLQNVSKNWDETGGYEHVEVTEQLVAAVADALAGYELKAVVGRAVATCAACPANVALRR